MMESEVISIEEPKLHKPKLVVGLPGVGLVASICSKQLINEMKARKFAELRSPYFQDVSAAGEEGEPLYPRIEFFHERQGSRDLIVMYGNTQALTRFGQYDLCQRTMELASKYGSEFLVTIGGVHRAGTFHEPAVFTAASDEDTVKIALQSGAKTFTGRIYGVAGLIVGIAKVEGLRGLCLLGEIVDRRHDVEAARAVLQILREILGLRIEMTDLDKTAFEVRRSIEPFIMATEEKRAEFVGPV
jgi:uncharacterized protein (TIGR00162 family)